MNKKEYKICCCCKIKKSLEQFNWKYKIKGIKQSQCKKCHAAVNAKHYINNKALYIKRAKAQVARAQLWLVEYKKSLKCSQCIENHPATLDFHHVIPSLKQYSISQMASHHCTIDLIIKEIEKCVVLCANCHRKLHYKEHHQS